MPRFFRSGLVCVLVLLALLTLTACNSYTYAEEDTLIIPASALSAYLTQDNVVFVDMQSAEDYAQGHLPGAVNIVTQDIMINVPVDNMLTSPKKLAELMGDHGIGDDTLIIAYDADKMTASRLLWSLKVYGNDNVRVVDGGIEAIRAAGLTLTTEVPSPTPVSFTAAEDKDSTWYVTIKEMQTLVEDLPQGVILLDTRRDDEYEAEGKIPGSLMMDYNLNFYTDGTFKNTQTTKINYLQAGIDPEQEIIIYCRTSMRAAPVFVRLYDAGYRNIKIYDGAWLEWSSNSSNPVEYADTSGPAATVRDAS